ncbi:hypothetical protein Nepgr_011160 [Nepenthes gracilis]|uniref:PCI domain-containing protein n=1 Tax=Nepenthes gracilis TaxID=150966 RepID=A0AAD3SEP8_NEPGR|nr:hypothetical protein Nepgr_011160 [Nepenthes gracilis]
MLVWIEIDPKRLIPNESITYLNFEQMLNRNAKIAERDKRMVLRECGCERGFRDTGKLGFQERKDWLRERECRLSREGRLASREKRRYCGEREEIVLRGKDVCEEEVGFQELRATKQKELHGSQRRRLGISEDGKQKGRGEKREMDPKQTEVSQTFERFKAALARNDFDTSTRLLSHLKVLLTGFRSLPPLLGQTPNALHELAIARDIYEHAVVLSVKMEDQDAFERDFLQLKPYYTDASGRLPQSAQEYPILGLNLLRLLVQNRIAEFHTELELLSPTALENACIKHAVELEQSFMEGAYNRVLSARQTVPHVTYVYFMDLLAKTVRDEIAGCSEKAYDYLSINDARQMLLFSSDQELLAYIKEEHPEWEIKEGLVVFQKAKELAPCKEIPSLQLINQTLSYARELERIV